MFVGVAYVDVDGMATSAVFSITGSEATTGDGFVSGALLTVDADGVGVFFFCSAISTETGREVGRGGGVLPVFGRGGTTADDCAGGGDVW